MEVKLGAIMRVEVTGEEALDAVEQEEEEGAGETQSCLIR